MLKDITPKFIYSKSISIKKIFFEVFFSINYLKQINNFDNDYNEKQYSHPYSSKNINTHSNDGYYNKFQQTYNSSKKQSYDFYLSTTKSFNAKTLNKVEYINMEHRNHGKLSINSQYSTTDSGNSLDIYKSKSDTHNYSLYNGLGLGSRQRSGEVNSFITKTIKIELNPPSNKSDKIKTAGKETIFLKLNNEKCNFLVFAQNSSNYILKEQYLKEVLFLY